MAVDMTKFPMAVAVTDRQKTISKILMPPCNLAKEILAGEKKYLLAVSECNLRNVHGNTSRDAPQSDGIGPHH